MFIVSTGDDMLQSAEEYVQKLFLSPFWKMEKLCKLAAVSSWIIFPHTKGEEDSINSVWR